LFKYTAERGRKRGKEQSAQISGNSDADGKEGNAKDHGQQ
jgi:hypothetical protein